MHWFTEAHLELVEGSDDLLETRREAIRRLTVNKRLFSFIPAVLLALGLAAFGLSIPTVVFAGFVVFNVVSLDRGTSSDIEEENRVYAEWLGHFHVEHVEMVDQLTVAVSEDEIPRLGFKYSPDSDEVCGIEDVDVEVEGRRLLMEWQNFTLAHI